jgi:hypothetical protein
MRGGGCRVAVYKRGNVWWYEFQFQGKKIKRTAKTRDEKLARTLESSARKALELEWADKLPREALKTQIRLLARQPGFDQALLEIMEEQEQEMES